MIDYQSLIRAQSKYAFNSEKYLRDVLNFKCVKWQSQACHDYDTKGHCAWSTGSGVGKTALLARLGMHFLHTRPYPVIPCTAPTQRQLYNVLWAEYARVIAQSSVLSALFEWQQERIFLKGHKDRWFAVAITSTPPKPGSLTTEALQGYHADNILFEVDECSGIADQVLGAADGAMSTPSARAILASNPTRNTGYFYRATFSPELEELWARIFVDAEEIDAPYIDKTYIRRLKIIYGENSDYFRMRVRGLPPRTEFNALISPEQVFAAHQRVLPLSGHLFLSCDPARYGDDDTVIILRDGNVITERVAVHGMDTMQVVKAILQLAERCDPEEYRIDVIGIGAGVVDKLKLDLGVKRYRVKSVHVGEDANDKETFFNKRAEIMWQLRTQIDNISIPIDTPYLDEELVAIHYGWDNKDKRIKLEPKDDTKKILNPRRSPNDADALGLNCADLRTATGIVNAAYFKIGARNSENVESSLNVTTPDAELVSARKDGGKQRVVDIMSFLGGKYDKRIGVNRYDEFKVDHHDFDRENFSQ